MSRKNFRYLIPAAAACLALLALLYYRKVHRSPWILTQYGHDDGNQMMFYSVTNAKGELLLIDGGWDTDAGLVREVIDAHGGHVDAWIITHPHPDHCGAFNAIMAANTDGSVVVDRIYGTKVNRARYEETAHAFDVIESYYIFDELTKNAGNFTILEEGDTFGAIGLNVSVLHGWDEHVDALDINLCNDGSLMFRLDAPHDSVLFCSDVQSEMEEFIVPAHRDELQATYVQCGHHGNWGLTEEFYDLVDPEGAFFDSPSSIVDSEDEDFDAYLLRDYFRKKGIPVYRFTTAPNSVELR